ncbi:hypothetical protein CHLRE_11g467579v5 [Chlamydomonas reinhardtii]|uniref:Uncharacterized protein n=1 Tax=Chlamydomonas reinhardtii TaxID=3055 RepID=A0A2K3D7D3_CHLRE|nr:uncharacterized protein CHLRE_11g467579v5 [Chlamydomonas reinhardtii]PNW76430.1 hypothetical protein CHLRE_11g467579v5 [Chlamydomonas reinhardtii]
MKLKGLTSFFTTLRRVFFLPPAQSIDAILDSKLKLLRDDNSGQFSNFQGQFTNFQGQFSNFQGQIQDQLNLHFTDVQKQFTSLHEDVARVSRQQDYRTEIAASAVLHRQFHTAGAPRTLRRAEDVAAVLILDGDPLLPTTMSLVDALLHKDVGFWHLLLYSVKKLPELARGQAPNSSMAMAANELLELEAERLVQATATAAAAAAAAAVASSAAVGSQEQCTTSSSGVEVESEVQLQRAYLLKVVPLLHRSGLGRILFADELDAYLQREDSAAARTNLLLGRAVPFLTAVATGEAADELQLDRCSGVSLSRGRAPAQSADLHLGELAILSSRFEDGRQQLEWSATTLAWAYHAARLAGEAQGGAGGVLAMTRALPPVLTVHAHLLFSLPDWRPGQPQPGAYRVEALPVLGCPLTVYYNYQHGRVHYRRW